MADLSTVKQVRWPLVQLTGGATCEIRMNRPGFAEYDQADADTLIFVDAPPLISDIPFDEKFTTQEGRRAFDDISLEFYDRTGYTGTIDGGAIVEEFGGISSTVLSQLFNVKGSRYEPLLYRVWLTYFNAASVRDIFFMGTYDANIKPQTRQHAWMPETGTELVIGIRTVQVVSALSLLQTTLWLDALKLIGESDCIMGQFFNGFAQTPGYTAGYNNAVKGLFDRDVLNTFWIPAAPYIRVEPEQNGVVLRSANAMSFDGRANNHINSTTPWPATPWAADGVVTSASDVSFTGGGYVVGDTGTILGGDENATYIVTSISGGGAVETITITNPGTGYSNEELTPTERTSGSGLGLRIRVKVNEDWGPWGTWGIKIGTIIAKIAEAATFDTFDPATDLIAGKTIFRQIKDAANKYFPLDDGAVPPANWYVSLNAYAGAHPWDGKKWETDVVWKPEEPTLTVLSQTADFLLSDVGVSINQTNGKPKLVFTRLGEPNGGRPAKWIQGKDISEIDSGTRNVSVTINNKGDQTKIVAPVLTQRAKSLGNTVAREIPFRLKAIGRTSVPSSYQAEQNGVPTYACTFDASLDQEHQADSCLKIAYLEKGDQTVHVNEDCWKGLCYVYYYTGDTATWHEVYPDIFEYFDHWNGAAEADSFYVLGAQFPYGTDVPYDTNRHRFNSREFQAVVLSRYVIPEPTLLQRNYGGIEADDGTLSSVQRGFTESWHYDGQIRTFRANEVHRLLRRGVSTVKWEEVGSVASPDINDVPFATDGSSSGTTSSSSSSTSGGVSSGGSGGGTTSTTNTSTPVTISVNTNNWSLVASAYIFFISASAPVNVTGVVGGLDGREIVLINVGTEPITFVSEDTGSDAANRFKFSNGRPKILSADGELRLIYQGGTVNRWRANATGG